MKILKKLLSSWLILGLCLAVILSGAIGKSAPTAADTSLSASASVTTPTRGDSVPTSLPISYKDKKLYPGGVPFGVKFYTDGIIVIGFSDVEQEGGRCNPAYDAGLRLKDVITSVNGKELSGAAELTKLVESSEGNPLELTYVRGGKSYSVKVTPRYSTAEGRYKSGLWVRDSGAGIGTVTYIDPETLSFGGLGHGICDGDTGELIPMDRGSVMDVKINGITKGTPGAPGEIKGYFNSGKTGTLISNTACGVYGILGQLPSGLPEPPLPVGSRNDVTEGEAYIRCTLDDGGAQKYSIRISDINRAANGNKCFTVTVTDKALIEKTGGIVQGMSGSPIIQNGKLVGAVTHVLINDPTTGYGIFIENMLSGAEKIK